MLARVAFSMLLALLCVPESRSVKYADLFKAIESTVTEKQWARIVTIDTHAEVHASFWTWTPETQHRAKTLDYLTKVAQICGVTTWKAVRDAAREMSKLQSFPTPSHMSSQTAPSPTVPASTIQLNSEWLNRSKYEPWYRDAWQSWSNRAARVVKWIRNDSRGVLDIGAGQPMHIKAHLPSSVPYYPADLVAWNKDTIVCDLNAGNYPRPPAPVDTVVAVGVLDYVKDVAQFFCKLRQYRAEVILFVTLVPHSAEGIRSRQRMGARAERTGDGLAVRHNSLYLHEFMAAARDKGGFVLSHITYFSEYIQKTCSSLNADEQQQCYDEDAITVKLMPLLLAPQGC